MFLDGNERLGATPLVLERPGGTRLSLTLVKDTHAPRNVTAVFDSGRRLTMEVTLTLKQGELVVLSLPLTGAEILVDGERRGRTPDRISVAADIEHLVEVRGGNFRPWTERVKLRPGESRKIAALLQPARVKGGKERSPRAR